MLRKGSPPAFARAVRRFACRGMMRTCARVLGLISMIIPVPVFTLRFSARRINLVTPVPAGIVCPLVEGLKSRAVCRNGRIRGLAPA